MRSQNSKSTSRRSFAFGAGLVGLSAAAVRASAQSAAPMNSDITVLNYALTLEHLEAVFYTQGLNRFTASDFGSATFARVLGSGTVNGVYANLSRIRDHEVTHVGALEAAVRSLGGTPVQACSYNFSYQNPDEFLQVAATLENLGVEAYDGALAMLQASALKAAGASIATVEARHAAYINLVIGDIPFPRILDDTKTMSEVLAAAAPLISSCGGTPVGMATAAMLMPKNFTTFDRQVTLDASQSISGNAQPLTYQTRVVSGAAAITGAGTSRPVVQLNGGPGEYTFEVTVTDTNGRTSTDRVTIRYAGI